MGKMSNIDEEKSYSPIPPIPNEFWEDDDWAFDNYDMLVRSYPDQWVAVVDKQVISAGDDATKVIEMAEKKTGRKEFPVIFVEKTIRVY